MARYAKRKYDIDGGPAEYTPAETPIVSQTRNINLDLGSLSDDIPETNQAEEAESPEQLQAQSPVIRKKKAIGVDKLIQKPRKVNSNPSQKSFGGDPPQSPGTDSPGSTDAKGKTIFANTKNKYLQQSGSSKVAPNSPDGLDNESTRVTIPTGKPTGKPTRKQEKPSSQRENIPINRSTNRFTKSYDINDRDPGPSLSQEAESDSEEDFVPVNSLNTGQLPVRSHATPIRRQNHDLGTEMGTEMGAEMGTQYTPILPKYTTPQAQNPANIYSAPPPQFSQTPTFQPSMVSQPSATAPIYTQPGTPKLQSFRLRRHILQQISGSLASAFPNLAPDHVDMILEEYAPQMKLSELIQACADAASGR